MRRRISRDFREETLPFLRPLDRQIDRDRLPVAELVTPLAPASDCLEKQVQLPGVLNYKRSQGISSNKQTGMDPIERLLFSRPAPARGREARKHNPSIS